MSEVPDGDWQRWQDELQRCTLFSADVPEALDDKQRRSAECRNARYYAERRRVLSLVGPVRGIVFLREETLRALAGQPRDTPMTRWLRLHTLEYGDNMETVIDILNAGVEKAVREGVADMIAERNRASRAEAEAYRRTLSCDWCRDRGGCTGACY